MAKSVDPDQLALDLHFLQRQKKLSTYWTIDSAFFTWWIIAQGKVFFFFKRKVLIFFLFLHKNIFCSDR